MYHRDSKEGVTIPAGMSVRIPCRANTGPVEVNTPVLFEPDEVHEWSDGLEVYETLTTVKKGYVSRVNVEVHNVTAHGITLRNRTTLGRLQLVKSVTPVEATLREPREEPSRKDLEYSVETTDRDKKATEENVPSSGPRIPEVD